MNKNLKGGVAWASYNGPGSAEGACWVTSLLLVSETEVRSNRAKQAASDNQ